MAAHGGISMVFDLMLRPHCDLHMALAGTPPLTMQVFRRADSATTPGTYTLTPVPHAECVFEFMAPHNDPGHRFDNLPTVDAAGVVTATHPGVYLFQVRRQTEYIVGRLQVHNQFVGWWFGNDSITTAEDSIAHAQPSIYAKFSDDLVGGVPVGTDLIGDITGHGYVQLTSPDPGKVAVTPEGRLRGVTETTTPVNITGTFPGQPPRQLPVRVVDYTRRRRDLFPVQAPDLARFQEMHNIVFVSEGFTEADRGVFDEIVTKAVDEIFNDKRHEPYAMLEGSFNIFKAFVPSQQHTLTTGFRVTDGDAGIGPKAPIPFNTQTSDDPNIYTLEELVAIVGLPKRGENRPNLKAVWGAQGLTNFRPEKVDDKLIEAWKAHQSVGILHAQDTFFGMHLGRRWADRSSGFSDPAKPMVTRPATDAPGDPMKNFVARVYEFYTTFPTRIMTPDPRRHPPELQASAGFTNPGNAIVAYLKGLDYAFAPFHAVGPVWEPDDTRFKPSRGLVALITHDGVIDGTNLNNNTLTALTMARHSRLSFAYADPNDKREMRRQPPAKIEPDFQDITDTIAHEFGHSFNLLDEYEDFGEDDPDAGSTVDLGGDNVTRLGVVRFGAAPSRDIDPSKVKWFSLLRMRVSARLTAPSQQTGTAIKVTIDKRYMAKWVEARAESAEVHLRNFKVGPQGQQLPLATGFDQYLTGLRITDLDVAQGTITLTGLVLPPAGAPPFATGSALFVPLRDDQGQLVTVVEKKVLDHLATTHKVLNVDPDISKRNKEPDHPVSISGFKAPCKSSKLIGIYEGADRRAGGNYRPAGNCKMRTQADTDQGGEFCFVCKWLIVNRVDPHYHAILSGMFYPEAKKNG